MKVAPGRLLVVALLAISSSLALAQDPVAGTDSLSTLAPLDASGEVTYYISAGADGSAFLASDTELATWALQAWERHASGKLRFSPASESAAIVRVYWVAPGLGQYGEMRPILVDGRRGAAVYIRPDTDALGVQIAERAREDPLFRDTVVYLTCLHELGHALGLEHTADFDDIMYFFGFGGDILEFFQRYRAKLHSREDMTMVAGVSAGDLAQLRALYGPR